MIRTFQHLSVLQALKAANRMFSIEEIESIMDDTAEAVEKQREIDALLTGQGGSFGHFRNLEIFFTVLRPETGHRLQVTFQATRRSRTSSFPENFWREIQMSSDLLAKCVTIPWSTGS